MDRERIGLVGCVKSKRGSAAPAADLYTSAAGTVGVTVGFPRTATDGHGRGVRPRTRHGQGPWRRAGARLDAGG